MKIFFKFEHDFNFNELRNRVCLISRNKISLKFRYCNYSFDFIEAKLEIAERIQTFAAKIENKHFNNFGKKQVESCLNFDFRAKNQNMNDLLFENESCYQKNAKFPLFNENNNSILNNGLVFSQTAYNQEKISNFVDNFKNKSIKTKNLFSMRKEQNLTSIDKKNEHQNLILDIPKYNNCKNLQKSLFQSNIQQKALTLKQNFDLNNNCQIYFSDSIEKKDKNNLYSDNFNEKSKNWLEKSEKTNSSENFTLTKKMNIQLIGKVQTQEHSFINFEQKRHHQINHSLNWEKVAIEKTVQKITNSKNIPSCSICMCEMSEFFSEIDECGHKFCTECINQWSKHSTTCPLCKVMFKNLKDYEKTRQIKKRKVASKKLVYEYEETSEDRIIHNADNFCYACNKNSNDNFLMICDKCLKKCCHTFCLNPPLNFVPQDDWFCDFCCQEYEIRSKHPTADLFVDRNQNGAKRKTDNNNRQPRRQSKTHKYQQQNEWGNKIEGKSRSRVH